MNQEEKLKEFSTILIEETDTFYKWSEGVIRISGDILELIAHKVEEKCGRSSLLESGSHKPGRDQEVYGESVSSKSSKLEDNNFKISSYRLTTCENIEDFIYEIKKRDESFTKYLVCLTEVLENKHIVRWGFIDKSKTDISNVDWNYVYGKSGRKSKLQSSDGKFNIHFSMSNQLWINLTIDDFDTICTYEYDLKKWNVTK
jgi:hypothetical protein